MATNNILDLFSLLNSDMKEQNVPMLPQRCLICSYIERSMASGEREASHLGFIICNEFKSVLWRGNL